MYQVSKSSLSFFIHFFPPGFNKDKGTKTKQAQEGLDKPKQFEIGNLFTHILGGENKWGAKPALRPCVAIISGCSIVSTPVPWTQLLSKSLFTTQDFRMRSWPPLLWCLLFYKWPWDTSQKEDKNKNDSLLMTLPSQTNKINKNAINLDSFGLKDQETKIRKHICQSVWCSFWPEILPPKASTSDIAAVINSLCLIHP